MIELSRNDAFKREPLVSVLMLAYKHEPYIAEAIEGVLAQRCSFPVELIVAEDCSPDGTRKIAERYLDQNPSVIRIVTGEKNIGVMPNLYRALDRCRGKYIAFCEGDDYWCNLTKLEKQVALMELDAGLGMVHGNYVAAHFSKVKWSVGTRGAHDGRPAGELSGELFSVVLRDLVPRTCTVLLRRSVLDAFCNSILGNPNYVAGDIPITVFCAANWRIGYVEEIVAVYRLSPNSATRTDFRGKLRFFDGLVKIRDDIESMFGHRPDFDPRSAVWVHDTHALIAFRANDQVAFAQAVSRLRRIDQRLAERPGLRARGMLLEVPKLAPICNRLIDLFRLMQAAYFRS